MSNWRHNQCRQIIALSIGLAVVAVASATMNVATYQQVCGIHRLIETSESDDELKAYVREQVLEVTKRLDDMRSGPNGKR